MGEVIGAGELHKGVKLLIDVIRINTETGEYNDRTSTK